MLQMTQEFSVLSIGEEIQFHPAWMGSVSGLEAENQLKGRKQPYVYVLRSGEVEGAYYVSFLMPDLSIKHQPFVLMDSPQGWHYENTGAGGPFAEASLDDVLHLIMHCHKDECKGLNYIAKK